MVASRDMLAVQWGLGVLLGEQPEFGGLRVAHDMLNARVRVALRGLNAKVKDLLLFFTAAAPPAPQGTDTPTLVVAPQVPAAGMSQSR
eukprot:9713745-Prorocentrum_lima.AAC.1